MKLLEKLTVKSERQCVKIDEHLFSKQKSQKSYEREKKLKEKKQNYKDSVFLGN